MVSLFGSDLIVPDPVNIALHKPGVMSTIGCYDGENSVGTDGKTDPSTGPFVHTCQEATPYYRIDLQQR